MKKRFPIKFVTFWYHPIFSMLKVHLRLGQLPICSLESMRCHCPAWLISVDLCLSGYYHQEEWIPHLGLTTLAPHSNFFVSIQTLLCLKDLPPQPPQLPEDFSEVSGDADFSNIFPPCMKCHFKTFFWDSESQLWCTTFPLVQWFSTGGHVWPPGDIWQCLEILSVVTSCRGYCRQQAELRDAGKQCTVPSGRRTALNIERSSNSKRQQYWGRETLL